MRILLVSQMYPGPTAPDLGVFVADLASALEDRGHELAAFEVLVAGLTDNTRLTRQRAVWIMAAAAFALAGVGPGNWSLDNALGLFL